jgi:hypothetical protein
MDLKEVGWEGIEWIHLAQVIDKLQAYSNAVTYGFHKMKGIS